MKGRPWQDFPPTTNSLSEMMKEAARIGLSWGWKASDVNSKRVMTHAEAASNKDGRGSHDNYGPVAWGGTGERWDLFRLRKNDGAGTGGQKLRNMMAKFMLDPNILKGAGNEGSEMDLFQRLVLAEAKGEGTLGMALVARAVMNRAGLAQQGGDSFGANGTSITDMIMAQNQFQSVSDGSIHNDYSLRQMQSAGEAIKLAKNSEALRTRLLGAGYDETIVNKLLGATGFKAGRAFNTQSGGEQAKFKNKTFDTAGNTDLRVLVPEINAGGTGGGRSSAGAPVESYWQKRRRNRRGGGAKSRTAGASDSRSDVTPSMRSGSNYVSPRSRRRGGGSQFQGSTDVNAQQRKKASAIKSASCCLCILFTRFIIGSTGMSSVRYVISIAPTSS